MGKYALLDTGYANTAAAGTQETRANSGNALVLNVESVSWQRATGTNSNANPGVYEDTEVNFASISNPQLTVQGILQVSDSNYLTELAALDDMCITKGVKHFYMNEVTAPSKPITEVKGATTHGSLSVGSSIKSLLVRVINLSFSEPNNEQTKGVRRYTLKLEVTNPKS